MYLLDIVIRNLNRTYHTVVMLLHLTEFVASSSLEFD